MRARQQQQASQIFKVQQKQYDPAYLEELDSYIVGGMNVLDTLVLCSDRGCVEHVSCTCVVGNAFGLMLQTLRLPL